MLGCCWPGGAAPPLFGSTPPPLLGVPVEGVDDDAGGAVPLEGAGVPVEGAAVLGVPPPDPPIGVPVPVPSFAFLFFLLSPGCTGSPVVTGGVVTGATVVLEDDPPPATRRDRYHDDQEERCDGRRHEPAAPVDRWAFACCLQPAFTLHIETAA